MSLPITEIPATAPKPLTTWKHYKGGIYTVTAVGQHTSNGVLLVVYLDAVGRTWCRPLNQWRHIMPGNVRRFTEIP